MRKLIALSVLCLFSLLLKNERGNCESNCQVSCSKKAKAVLKTEATSDAEKIGIKTYDGFFFKI